MKWYLMAFRKAFDFNGRARRKEFWMFQLFNIIFLIAIAILEVSLGFPNTSPIQLVYNIIILIPALSLSVRRMHDIDKSGWFILIPIYRFFLEIREGDLGYNRFGEDPKQI